MIVLLAFTILHREPAAKAAGSFCWRGSSVASVGMSGVLREPRFACSGRPASKAVPPDFAHPPTSPSGIARGGGVAFGLSQSPMPRLSRHGRLFLSRSIAFFASESQRKLGKETSGSLRSPAASVAAAGDDGTTPTGTHRVPRAVAFGVRTQACDLVFGYRSNARR